MLPPAPGRFSTTIGWPSFSPSLGPRILAMVSVLPPGGNVTTRRIGLVGYVCAEAANAAQASAVTSAKRRMAIPLFEPFDLTARAT